MRRGKTGAGLPGLSSRPATIKSPGAIATSASRSMMIPKDRLRRLCIGQPRRWEQALSGRPAVSASKKASPDFMIGIAHCAKNTDGRPSREPMRRQTIISKRSGTRIGISRPNV